jgi:hypothetical protein
MHKRIGSITFEWCDSPRRTARRSLSIAWELDSVRPFHVAAYIEQMPGSKPTIKQKLAAIRMLYDFWLSGSLCR